MGRTKINLDKGTLHRLYLSENLSPAKIGAIFGCSFKTVRNRLEEFEIPFKDPALARLRSKRRGFDGSKETRAYMVGFRLGDLNVYRPSERSLTVVVRGHTTQDDQVSIMKGLFSDFGRVTVSLNKGHYHVNCFLDNSFLFLLPKNLSAWEWIKKSDTAVAAAFIAGYVDAEANFILNQGRARFKIDSYDDEILEWMSEWLTSHGIENSYRIIYQIGDTWKGKSPINKNLWRLNINEMESLLKFIDIMVPLLRHKKRIRDMLVCKSNIESRQIKRKKHEADQCQYR